MAERKATWKSYLHHAPSSTLQTPSKGIYGLHDNLVMYVAYLVVQWGDVRCSLARFISTKSIGVPKP